LSLSTIIKLGKQVRLWLIKIIIQGNDSGTQYRSAIFYHDDEQKRIALLSIAAAQEAKLYSQPFVTEVTKAGTFYPAEAYHQDYYKNNPSQGYCRAVVGPKVKKFQELFREKLKSGN